jgi:hypothetical protein
MAPSGCFALTTTIGGVGTCTGEADIGKTSCSKTRNVPRRDELGNRGGHQLQSVLERDPAKGTVMRTVRVDKNREVEVPTTWSEVEAMIANALGSFYDDRGKNLARLSIAARVAHGMFGKQLMAGDPTLALLYLLQRICICKGAGLDTLKERSRENVG